jgi:hypothetical protein
MPPFSAKNNEDAVAFKKAVTQSLTRAAASLTLVNKRLECGISYQLHHRAVYVFVEQESVFDFVSTVFALKKCSEDA